MPDRCITTGIPRGYIHCHAGSCIVEPDLRVAVTGNYVVATLPLEFVVGAEADPGKIRGVIDVGKIAA